MFKSFIIFCSVILCLVLADVETDILSNDVIFADIGNNDSELEFVPTQNPPYAYRDIGEKKVVNIVVNPIIHNVANGYGGGSGGGQNDKPTETTTSAPVSTTTPPDQLLAEVISVFFRKTRFLTRFMLNGAGAFLRAIIRFIICTFLPICGIFGAFSDEINYESTATPEGVAQALNLIEGIIEDYHSALNRTQ